MTANVEVTCNICGKTVKATTKTIKPCKCGSTDLVVEDGFDALLDKYKKDRKDHWEAKRG